MDALLGLGFGDLVSVVVRWLGGFEGACVGIVGRHGGEVERKSDGTGR